MIRGLLTIAAAAALLPAAAGAQTKPFDPREGFNPPISDELVADMSSQVLDNFPSLQCGRGRCAPATEAERQNGLVSRAEARELIRKGMVSAVGECAGVDWRRVGFDPMMAEWRKRPGVTERQLAFVGELHRASMFIALLSVPPESCPRT